MNSSDSSPSPSMFEANTITESVVEGEQSEEGMLLNSWLHMRLVHDEAGMLIELHSTPEVELV